jgi:pimeloyl-[acyl-carrier protein] methyl ester esterase
MTVFALCHGWAFDARALSPLAQALKQRLPNADVVNVDLGFTGAPQFLPQLSEDAEWVAVGHSYGFAWLLRQALPWRAAISLNGFTRFCRRPGRPQGTPTRVIDAMLARLRDDPEGVVREFRLRCGTAAAFAAGLDVPALIEHLSCLRDLDLALPSCPLLALATDEDLIVPRDLSQACFSEPDCSLQISAGDHLHLLQKAGPTADAIARFCRERSCLT